MSRVSRESAPEDKREAPGQDASDEGHEEDEQDQEAEQDIFDLLEDYDYEERGYRRFQSQLRARMQGRTRQPMGRTPAIDKEGKSPPVAPGPILMSIGLSVQEPQGPSGKAVALNAAAKEGSEQCDGIPNLIDELRIGSSRS